MATASIKSIKYTCHDLITYYKQIIILLQRLNAIDSQCLLCVFPLFQVRTEYTDARFLLYCRLGMMNGYVYVIPGSER